jgi:nitroreductase
MTTEEVIDQRRSIRKFKSEPIADNLLEEILQAAQKAPSAHNYQPWKIVVVKDEGILSALTADQAILWAKDEETQSLNLRLTTGAPVILVGCTDERESVLRFERGSETVISGKWPGFERELGLDSIPYTTSASWDIAIAFDHITLAARDHGIGSCWIATFNVQKIREVLKIPSNIRVELLLTLGYPDSWPEKRPRKEYSDLFCFDRYRS